MRDQRSADDMPEQIRDRESAGMPDPCAGAYAFPDEINGPEDSRSAEARVRQMEELFDRLSEAVTGGCIAKDAEGGLREAARILSEYLGSGAWLKDYERDEQGLFPAGLKRGVLSQDGLYDLLGDPSVVDLLSE